MHTSLWTKRYCGNLINLSEVTPLAVILLFVYFILGYALFALVYAITGSSVSRSEDVQAANAPVAIMVVIGFYLSYFSMMDPANSIAIFAGYFPLSAAFCMPFRIIMGAATAWETVISIGILIVTILIIAKISIRIYSQAILNYGMKLNLKDMFKIYKTK